MDKVITPDVLLSTPFFREFMHEHGALHGMRAVICSDEAGSASLLCGRSKEQGNFTEQDLAQCKAMLPHLQQALERRPAGQSVVITGRSAPAPLLALADTVSEIADTRHAFQAGVKAQAGVDF